MSEDGGRYIWVRDLDEYFDLDSIEEENESEDLKKLNFELDEIGDIKLLAGKTTSSHYLYEKQIQPSDWRNALHKSEMIISINCRKFSKSNQKIIEHFWSRFLNGMIDLGRRYSVARYARWERLDYSSALISTFPHGLRALINQFLASEGIDRQKEVDAIIRSALNPYKGEFLTAYRHAGILQKSIHQIANNDPNHSGGNNLNRKNMRVILSLARLYFSTIELKINSLENLKFLMQSYEEDRMVAMEEDSRITTNGRFIKSWGLRHMRPLLDLYPYVIRHSFKRALVHESKDFDHTMLVNELALAHCGIMRMTKKGIDNIGSSR